MPPPPRPVPGFTSPGPLRSAERLRDALRDGVRRTPRRGIAELANDGVVLAQAGGTGGAGAAATTKTLTMPGPAGDQKTKVVREVTWDLVRKEPRYGDVEQQTLANCPLAALLAALAYTPGGRKHLKSVVKPHRGGVETDVSAVAGSLDATPPGNKLLSNRYFTVTIDGRKIDVSDVFYTNDGARDTWSLIYMTSPKESLWPCVVEKAFAAKEGGYSEIDSLYAKKPLTLNDFWIQLVGKEPEGFKVTAETTDARLQAVAKAAAKVPTVAASKRSAASVTGWHGYAVLGMSGGKLKLYDPMKPGETTVALKDFRQDFEAVLYGSP